MVQSKKETPWASCILTRMMILYLEESGLDSSIDFNRLIGNMEYHPSLSDPKSFLRNPDNWIPHRVLNNMVRATEETTGDKRAVYWAARNYYQAKERPSLLEIIARLLNNVEQIVHFSSLWAEGFTNYLRLQCIRPTGREKNEVIVLSQFDPSVEPSLGSANLIKGNYEGFTALFESIKNPACIEEMSQIQMETFVKEFPEYSLKRNGNRLSITSTDSKKEIVTAEKVLLKNETVEMRDDSPAADSPIVQPRRGAVEILGPTTDMKQGPKNKSRAAFRIIDGGVLRHGRLEYAFEPGQVFNAPYSRYRFSWNASDLPQERERRTHMRDQIIPLLFDHLRQIRETQKAQLDRAIETEALIQSNESLKTAIQREFDFFGMIGKNSKMHTLYEQVRQIAPTDSTVLILGETGTGKELLAKAIHEASDRRDSRFFAVNCTALPETLLESELFGYEKGAFTGAATRKKGIFESAHGGTLFLDEIGDTTPAMQAKLLRVLENQEIQRVGGREAIPVDVRIISATNKNLKSMVDSEKFRSDLYYRLHVISLDMPPLRERLDDMILLADHFLEFYSKKNKKPKPELSREALALLESYRWPGNIRELKNVLERAVVLNRTGRISPADIVLPEPGKSPAARLGVGSKSFQEAIDGFKRSVIEETLKRTGGNQTQAAKILGLQRTYLSRLIRLFHITPKT